MTNNKIFFLRGFHVYSTPHPDGTAHGGSAVIIKSSIKHYVMTEHRTEQIQACSIVVTDWVGPLAVTSVYCPPRHSITENSFNTFFSALGGRFIAGGDWNAKNTCWRSRLTVTRGRELKNSIHSCGLEYLSTGEPTY